MNAPNNALPVNRRTLLKGAGASAFLASLGSRIVQAQDTGSQLTGLHHAARAKRVIWLYMAGGPSQLESFDYKPELAKRNGQLMPASLTKDKQVAQLQGKPLNIFAPQFKFARHGQSGQAVTSLFPNIASIADDIAIVRSMKTDAINHDPAHTFMNTGSVIAGRPSMGSWLLNGLGAPGRDLPGYVVMVANGKGGMSQPIAARQWHSGFLPGGTQGVRLQSAGDPVAFLAAPAGVSMDEEERIVKNVSALDRMRDTRVAGADTEARISQYEMAFRMQSSVPDLVDLSDESSETLKLYGTNGRDGSFAAACLRARRLLQRGVRVVQLYHRDWDHHQRLRDNMSICAGEVDRASAALVKDLKRLGMLEDTLVVWGGEFGRTPMAQGDGRDHHIQGFSYWLAGGGVKAGHTVGATDELGYEAVEDPVHVHDLHATILHLMGIDHLRLTHRHQGRDFRLTDVAGQVVRKLLA